MIDIEQHIWGFTSEGEAVILYTLVNGKGTRVNVTNFGAGVVSATVCDGDGGSREISLGSSVFTEYLYNIQSVPSLTGFSGRTGAFYRRMWESRTEVNRVVFAYMSPDNDDGFKGEMGVEVVYDLNDDNTLDVSVFAAAGDTTRLNMTNPSLSVLSATDGVKVISGNISNGIHELPKGDVFEQSVTFQL